MIFFYNKSCRLKNIFNGVMVIKQKTTTSKILTEVLNSPPTSKLPLPMCKKLPLPMCKIRLNNLLNTMIIGVDY